MAKTVLITGASGNLGTAAVKTMLGAGYKVVAIGHAPAGDGQANEDGNLEYIAIDLANEQEVNDGIAGILQRYQTIDAALLLVGGFAMGGIEDTGSGDLKKMFAMNFDTAYHVARPLFMHMSEKNYGRIVFIGARAPLKPAQGKAMIAYALSKSLLFKLAEFLNEEAKGKDVVSSVVIPSTIDTPQNRQSMPDADFSKWVQPEQIAAILRNICNEESGPLREPVYKVYGDA